MYLKIYWSKKAFHFSFVLISKLPIECVLTLFRSACRERIISVNVLLTLYNRRPSIRFFAYVKLMSIMFNFQLKLIILFTYKLYSMRLL